MVFISRQLYPRPAEEAPLGSIRSRHVIYIQGFFPKGAAYYHSLLGEELAHHAALYEAKASLSPLRRVHEVVRRCEIVAASAGSTVKTTYDFLEWEDLIDKNRGVGIPASLARAVRSFFIHLADGSALFMAQTFWKYFAAWLFPYAAFAGMAVLGFAILVLLPQFFAGWPGPWPLIKIILCVCGILILWQLSHLWWSPLMLRNFDAVVSYARGRFPQLDERIDRFADYIFEICRNSLADEILIVGHSFGTSLAVMATAKASQHGAFENSARRVKLLSLGDVTCHIGSLQGPGAARLRQAVLSLGKQQALPWVLLYSGKDVLGFNTTDPPAALSRLEGKPCPIEDFHWPMMYDPVFRSALPREDYVRLRWRFFHMHSQFIFAARLKTAHYDYFRVICGAQPLPLQARRVSGKASRPL